MDLVAPNCLTTDSRPPTIIAAAHLQIVTTDGDGRPKGQPVWAAGECDGADVSVLIHAHRRSGQPGLGGP